MGSVQTEVRELVDYIRSLGFQVSVGKDSHWHVYKNGVPVAKPGGGTVILPSTPSDNRWRLNTIAMLKQARVIDDDPRLIEQRKLARRDPFLAEQRELARQEIARRRAAEQVEQRPVQPRQPSERQLAIAERAQLAAEALTGWEKFVLYAWRLAEKTGNTGGSAYTRSASTLGTAFELIKERALPANTLGVFEAALDDLGVRTEATVEAATMPGTIRLTDYVKERKLATGAAGYGLVARIRPGDKERWIELAGEHFICCNTRYTDRRAVFNHIRSKHLIVDCDVCGETFSAGGIGRHMATQHREAHRAAGGTVPAPAAVVGPPPTSPPSSAKASEASGAAPAGNEGDAAAGLQTFEEAVRELAALPERVQEPTKADGTLLDEYEAVVIAQHTLKALDSRVVAGGLEPLRKRLREQLVGA